MKRPSVKADTRKLFGRKVKKLRAENVLPANLYGKKTKSQALKVNLKEFIKTYKEVGETTVVDLVIGNSKAVVPVLIHNLQVDPVSQDPLHVDFHKIDLKQKVQVAIPIELKGQAPGASKGGALINFVNEIEVEALPTDLPDKLELDVSVLTEIGQSISVKDLKVDKTKIKVLADENQLLVKIEEPKEEKEEEKPAEEVSEEEADGEETSTEGKEDKDSKEDEESKKGEKGSSEEGKKAGEAKDEKDKKDSQDKKAK
ncbi:50S ribosomal protein L25 [Patescibacteria group bacterium]